MNSKGDFENPTFVAALQLVFGCSLIAAVVHPLCILFGIVGPPILPFQKELLPLHCVSVFIIYLISGLLLGVALGLVSITIQKLFATVVASDSEKMLRLELQRAKSLVHESNTEYSGRILECLERAEEHLALIGMESFHKQEPVYIRDCDWL